MNIKHESPLKAIHKFIHNVVNDITCVELLADFDFNIS